MAIIQPAQSNFNGGEVTPRLHARIDFNKYDSSLETGINILLLSHGPMEKRGGTRFVFETKDSTKASKLIPFQFDVENSFMFEFGDLYIRFYHNTGSPSVPTIIESSPGVPLEVVTTYTVAQIDAIQFAQNGNAIYLTHPDHTPRTLTRISTTSWTLADEEFSPPPTFQTGERPVSTLTPAATTGNNIVFTASIGHFLAADIGRQLIGDDGGVASIITITSPTVCRADIIEAFPSTSAIPSQDWRIDLSPVATLTSTISLTIGGIVTITSDKATWKNSLGVVHIGYYILIQGGVAQITQVTSATVVKAIVLKTITNGTGTLVWTLETPQWTAANGFPRSVTFSEQRIVYGGSKQFVERVWGSETAIFDGFGIGAEDDDSYEFDIVAGQVSEIQWLESLDTLVIGTSSSEVTLGGRSGALTSLNPLQQPRSYIGSRHKQPVKINDEIVFIQRSDRKVRTFIRDFDNDGYQSEDLTYFALHITEGDIKQVAVSQDPDIIIWANIEDTGQLIAGTYQKDQDVIGWSRFQIGGTAVFVESIAVITDDDKDQLWMIIKRTINGVTKRYVEVLDPTVHQDSFFVYDSTPTTVITGLGHLEGETVIILADGAAHPDKTVASGQITLELSASKVIVGLRYTATMKTLKKEVGSDGNIMQTQKVRPIKTTLRVVNSSIPTLNGNFRPSRVPADLMDTAVPLFTGDIEYASSGWDTKLQWEIVSNDAFPLLVLGIFGSVDVNER